MLFAYVFLSETLLLNKGFAPTVDDTKDRWLNERKRATALGSKAMVIVGASRVQLGFDIKTLRKETAMEPVQLAIDGSSYVPILSGLARDPTISGTIIVDLMPGPISFDVGPLGASQHYQADYEVLAGTGFQWPTYLTFENWLSEKMKNNLANYANGARPWDSMLKRVLNPSAIPQYLVTFSDRSRQADYSQVAMPEFYLNRVLRHIGNPAEIPSNQPSQDLMRQLVQYIGHMKPSAGMRQSEQGLNALQSAVSVIQARGGRVYFVAMPTSGLVLAADKNRFPRELYWDKVVASTTAKTIHWQDYADMAGFECPDGSHLDRRDTVSFTNAFIRAAGLNRQ